MSGGIADFANSDKGVNIPAPRVVTLVVADVPPSLNRIHSRNWRVFYRHKKKWQGAFEGELLAASVPRGLSHVHAEADLRFRTRQRRDEGNFRWMLEKGLGDALSNGRWIADDTPEFFTTGALTFEATPGSSQTLVRLYIWQ